jgi:4-hydroxy-3-polyprenylbenzoate decarboxylase
MIVVPCTTKTLSGIAHGASTTLIERAADVCLKERRPVILVLREAPLSLVHLRNATAATEAGAVILPASPAFYQKPKTFDDLGDFIAGRVLGLLGIDQDLFPAWGETTGRAARSREGPGPARPPRRRR